MKRTLFIFAQIAFLFTAFSIMGCATDETDDNPDEETSSTEQDLSSNERAAFNYFVARGLTKKQSAGIVGNLIQESSVRPTAVEYGGGPGRGIAQWSVGGRWNASHHDNVTWYASTHGISRWALNTQLAFTWYELKTFSGYGLTPIRRATTIKAATIAFERDFEKCGNCQEAKRYTYAKQVYAAFAGTARSIEEADADDEDPIDVLPADEDLDAAE